MGKFTSFKPIAPLSKGKDSIRINRSSGKITASIYVYKFRDKDTRQIILYAPSLEVSGYGVTEKKAMVMLKFSIDDIFNHFINIPAKQLESELSRLKWKHEGLSRKVYSKVSVDADGNLKDFNAVDDHVESAVLTV